MRHESFLNRPGFARFLKFGLAATLALAAVPASAAGLLEALFGARRAPAVAPMPAPGAHSGFRELVITGPGKRRQSGKSKAAANFKVVKPVAGIGIASPFRPVLAGKAPPVLPGPLGPFLMDTTLYRGDVVVTTAGLRVFGGGYSLRHSSASFVPLSKAAGYVPGQQALLNAIERNNRRSDPAISYRQYVTPVLASTGFVVLKPVARHALLDSASAPETGTAPAR